MRISTLNLYLNYDSSIIKCAKNMMTICACLNSMKDTINGSLTD